MLVGYIGVILVLFAVFIITVDHNSQIVNHILTINYGDILIIASALLWAMDNNTSKIVSHKLKIAKIVQLKSFIGGSLLIVIVIAFGIKINIS
jgi:hypothetical protein